MTQLLAQTAVRDESWTLIDQLLAEERRLSAVERFSQRHAGVAEPLQARYYRDLIPIRKPGTAEQYGFEVDLDVCSGCKACVTACHSLNGLDEGESWRDVGLLHGGGREAPVQRTVTTACHHCGDPACAHGCPVLAYDKDPETGIVRHLDDQCIGCRYCELKCPYEVPKYNKRLGIVRKCDLCHGRLALAEAPACVQACPNQAITIRIVSTGDLPRSGPLVPGTFDSVYTRPATVFRSRLDLGAIGLEGADALSMEPAPGHGPLQWMLVFTQAGAGAAAMYVISLAASIGATGLSSACLALPLAAFGLSATGMIASVGHLGRPLGAWRAFLGWRRSWLSREIIAFSLLLPTLAAAAGASLLDLPWLWRLSAAIAAAMLGMAAVSTSIMVYVDTRRVFWRPWPCGVRFFGAWLLLGSALTTVFAPGSLAGSISILACAGKMAAEGKSLFPARGTGWSPEKKSALLQLGPLRAVLRFRWLAGVVGMLAIACGTWALPSAIVCGAGFVCLMAGELAERALFFRAVDTPKMPGGVAAQ
ncbi:MAG TPA: DmsC/YnfH family molybdoenzyme membrane anchor subunit [Verrucomicrobiales bacterium]|nr:DmsC/YnfH family molybdoenzyme membrane anchor subunit [Verrucomicrobiales bacterium]